VPRAERVVATTRDLPTGTVTFLFTDVEGSTRLLHELGDRYGEALARHRLVLQSTCSERGGVLVDTQGDATFYAFSSAAAAVAAAEEAQRALEVPVRMGIHTGEPTVTEQGYVGIDVHRAARIASAGYGGQVLVSQSTRDLVGGDALRDLGEHRLKDLTAPERVYQLGDGEFPPLRSLNATNLPVAANPLVGRGPEVAELAELLNDSVRLVTLTGPGGAGKTRLALQVAAELVESFPGGVFFVPLAGVGEPELVQSTIASTVGVREPAELRQRTALLIVDNFEHLLEAAPAVASLLAAAPGTKVLATSRAPLRIEGEREYAVDPLPEDDALALLTARARAVRPDFEPGEAAREICRRLDGLPLALELAAPRLRSLGAKALLERLDRRLPVLTGGRRDAPERQRTLRATIEWSYDLVSPEEQELFRRLAVFAGTFSLAAAEEVCDAGFDGVDALVEASLLKPVGEERFLMLETIRELALERLAESGEGDEIRRRHAEFFLELGQSANLNIEAEGPMRHQLVITDVNNLRAALDWTIASGEAELGLRLAVALENFWVTSDPGEGRRWLEALLALGGNVPPDLHALAIRCLGNCSHTVGLEEGLALYEQALAEFRALGDELRVGIMLHRVGNSAALRGDEERGRRLIEESLETLGRIGFTKGQANCYGLLGSLELRAGRPERALELYERSAALARETGFVWWEQNMLLSRSLALFALERPGEAARSAADSLEIARRIGDRLVTVDALVLVARAAAERDERERAGQLWGAVEAEIERAPLAGWDAEQELAAAPALARGGPEFEAGRDEGRKLSLDEAVALALS
jgi:predicted ATPase/class 3 adenylate cyclase